MCTNRALTDLYAFSARFIQLLNRKLAYVCIADYYKSEQNVLFCLTLIIIFMKKHFFNATFWALLSLALWTTGCSDDDGYSDVEKINELFNNSKFSILLRVGEEFPDKEYYTGNTDLAQLFNLQIYVDTDISWYEHCLEE